MAIVSSTSGEETVTLAVRIAGFVVALLMFGAFLLPWVQLDGVEESSSGAELIAVLASPTFAYLWLASPVEAGALVGVPIAALLAAVVVVYRIARRRTSTIALTLLLLLICALPVASRGLLATGWPHEGLMAMILLAGVLLIQHSAIRAVSVASQKGRGSPILWHKLRIVTGSGHYRWKEL